MDSLSFEARRFLIALFEAVNADVGGQASMYAVGEQIGLEKAVAKSAAEELFGLSLAEIRTLSGGVGICPAGVEAARSLGAGPKKEADDQQAALGSGPVLTDAECKAVEDAIAQLKSESEALKLKWSDLTELVADVRTLEAQLSSPAPKTAIVKAVLESMTSQTAIEAAVAASQKMHALLGR